MERGRRSVGKYSMTGRIRDADWNDKRRLIGKEGKEEVDAGGSKIEWKISCTVDI